MAGFVAKIVKSGLGIFTSRVFGMLRDITIAAYFGVNSLTDAFFVAFAVPNLFRAFFAEGALSSVFVPFLSDKLNQEGEKNASVYLSSLILSIGVVVVTVIGIVVVFPENVLLLFMPGYASDSELLSQASEMIILLMPFLLFITISALLTCYLNLKDSFFIPNASTFLLNVFMIVGAWFGYRYGGGILYVCYGVFFGGMAQTALVLSYAVHKGYRPGISGGYDKSVNRVFPLILPSLAGVGISQLNFMIGRIAASYLAVGSISYLYYANRLFQFPLGMFAVAVGTVTLADISTANSCGEPEKREGLIDKAVNAVTLVMLPAMAGLIILSEPIISLVYGRMNFGADDAAASASALTMYSSGLLFYSMISLFSRVFFSDKDIKTPLYGAGIGFIVNIVLTYPLINYMGHSGIALAASGAAFVNALYLYIKLKNYKYSLLKFGSFAIKVFSSVFLMSAAVYYADKMGVDVVLTVPAGIAVYFVSLTAMGINIRSILR